MTTPLPPMRAYRKSLGLTLAQVAKATGLSVSFLSDIERGRSKPSLSTLEKLAEVYRVKAKVFVEWYTRDDPDAKETWVHIDASNASPETIKALTEMLFSLYQNFDRLTKKEGETKK